jgi:hypothetical protein
VRHAWQYMSSQGVFCPLLRCAVLWRTVLCAMQASAFVLFPDIKSACDAVLPLKQHQVAVAVELHDWACLRCGWHASGVLVRCCMCVTHKRFV